MSGGELGALVAEKVMGWKYSFGEGQSGVGGEWFYEDKDGESWEMADDSWNPSENIEHAWEVVEHCMHQASRHFSVKRGFETAEPYGPSGYWVIFQDINGSKEAWATEVPMAICLAAIKIFGAEVPSGT